MNKLQFNDHKLSNGVTSFEFHGFIGVFETNNTCEQLIDYFELVSSLGLSYVRRKSRGNLLRDVSDEITSFSHLASSNDMQSEIIVKQDQNGMEACRSYVRAIDACLDIYHHEFSSLTEFNLRQDFPQIQLTKPGHGYHNFHFEKNTGELSNRVLATMMYLNDVLEGDGGETEFLYQNLRIQPKAGRVLIWPADWTHTHRGNPPLAGDKYIATSWVEAC